MYLFLFVVYFVWTWAGIHLKCNPVLSFYNILFFLVKSNKNETNEPWTQRNKVETYCHSLVFRPRWSQRQLAHENGSAGQKSCSKALKLAGLIIPIHFQVMSFDIIFTTFSFRPAGSDLLDWFLSWKLGFGIWMPASDKISLMPQWMRR